jgi:hypothetical protein
MVIRHAVPNMSSDWDWGSIVEGLSDLAHDIVENTKKSIPIKKN